MTKLLIAGEFIGKRETGGPFTNRAGVFFREIMTNAGITPDRATFMYPKDQTDLVIEIDKQNAEYVVLCGNNVLQLVHPELRIGECHGRVMALDPQDENTPLFFPVLHHVSAARTPARLGPTVGGDLRLLRRLAVDRANWRTYTYKTCVRCRGDVYVTTEYEVSWCRRHWADQAA